MLQNRNVLTENFQYDDGTLIHAQDFGSSSGVIKEITSEEISVTDDSLTVILSFVTTTQKQKDREVTINVSERSHLVETGFNNGILTLKIVPERLLDENSENKTENDENSEIPNDTDESDVEDVSDEE